MFVVSQNKRRSKADNQTDKNCMLQYSSLSAKENLYCSTAPPIYFQSILQACIIIIIRQLTVTCIPSYHYKKPAPLQQVLQCRDPLLFCRGKYRLGVCVLRRAGVSQLIADINSIE